jgi:hypothetical protein
MITSERLREILKYYPETGVFTWVVPTSFRVKVGDVAGSVCHGYIQIRVDRQLYNAHALAFLWMTGCIPGEIDHINRKRDDNRWCNIRPIEHYLNMHNVAPRKTNTSTQTGVHWQKRELAWKAYINIKGKRRNLGTFRDFHAAVHARKYAEKTLFPEGFI